MAENIQNDKKDQKVALVTGASSGIGKSIAERLIKEGFKVYTAARRLDKMKDLESQGALPLKMDITNKEDVKNVVDTITRQHGGVDILVNNAGFASYGAMEDTTIEDARYQFEVNIFGLAQMTQMVLPYMRAQKSGKIINISSMGGKIYTLLGSWYHATKHALEGWSDCLRLEVAPFGIDVVIIEPGIIKTGFDEVANAPMMKRSGNTAYSGLATKMEKAMVKSYEKGAASSPEVVAKAVSRAIYSSSPKTRYTPGKYSALMIFLRKYLSDRMFDKLVLTMS